MKHWRPEDEFVPLQPAERRKWTNSDDDGAAGLLASHPALVGLGLVAVACLGLAAGIYQAAGPRQAFAPAGSPELIPYFGECPAGGGRNCVLSGDTFDMDGARVRIAGIVAPQLLAAHCAAEERAGEAAARRLREWLNSGAVTVLPLGTATAAGSVTLSLVRVDGRELGPALVGEGHARPFGALPEGWC